MPVARPRPVVAGTQLTAVADRTGASGLGRSETGEPVVTEIQIQTARSELERDSDQFVGLPGPVARPEPEPVAR